jgi:hypothetical protein
MVRRHGMNSILQQLLRAILALALIAGGHGLTVKPSAADQIAAGATQAFHCALHGASNNSSPSEHSDHAKNCFACQCCGEATTYFATPEMALVAMYREGAPTRYVDTGPNRRPQIVDKAHRARAPPRLG